ncbi:MAG: low molecular weight phosphotyrosine protein phosphatase [Anaerolineales bacterium]|nr:low molecular weight phosphotyrosine protein phosphatase [Anaerolineales bacterium]
MSQETRILFVCQGNIIRSPLAEHMFKHLAEQAGLSDQFYVRSAGTSSYHVGESPDSRMRRVAAKNGFKYTGRARQFQTADFNNFDLIIAMDTQNLSILKRLAGSSEEHLAKLRTMRTFDPEGDFDQSVPDPYYGGIDGFQITFDIVKRSSQGLLEALQKGAV